jgi:SAM-dependent methyltransferase
MVQLLELVDRQAVPEPWAEGDKIPWNDPDFSRRMLAEHLSQAHDMASRRFAVIDKHVAWIHSALLQARPARILDLGCGPGLYTGRLARLGHECAGIDFSPASIAYARDQARAEGLHCTYLQHDIRTAEYSAGYGLVMLLFGEFNVFRPAEAQAIVRQANQALDEGGLLLLEAHTFAAVRDIGQQPRSWYSAPSGLFSERPHLVLTESFWDAQRAVATERHFVVDAATGDLARHAASVQAYTAEQYRSLLADGGLAAVTFYPSLTGSRNEAQDEFMVVVGSRA